MSKTIAPNSETQIIGGFDTYGKQGAVWVDAGFDYNGRFVGYTDDNAVVEGAADKLVMTANPYSHKNDVVQVVDNAKQMLFTAQPVAVPEGGSISFEYTLAATGYGTAAGELRDGFASFNALDFDNGLAFDWFTSNDRLCAVYARIGFPQVPGIKYNLEQRTKPATSFLLGRKYFYFDHIRIDRWRNPIYAAYKRWEWQQKKNLYFAFFQEINAATAPGQQHTYKIVYAQGQNRAEWWLDGRKVYTAENILHKASKFTLAYGLMTERDLGENGSVSCHGQGMRGEWSAIRVTTTPAT